jgi:hypothetical protein
LFGVLLDGKAKHATQIDAFRAGGRDAADQLWRHHRGRACAPPIQYQLHFHEGQPSLAAAVTPSEDLEDRSFERMVGPNDGYLGRVSVEMTAVVGSLSGGPLAVWTMDGSYASSNVESETHV